MVSARICLSTKIAYNNRVRMFVYNPFPPRTDDDDDAEC